MLTIGIVNDMFGESERERDDGSMLQYLMGCGCPGDISAEGRSTDRADRRDHSDIGVTLNVYTHLGFDDAAEEMERIQKAEEIREETPPKEEVTQKIFKVV